jgi:hypothetical protein
MKSCFPKRPSAFAPEVRGLGAIGVAPAASSGLPVAECGDYVAGWLRGERPPTPVADMSSALALRFAIDDLRAYTLEAALVGSRPSSQQQGDWLWNGTALGAALQVLRRDCLAGDDERLKAVAAFFVPALRVPPDG